MNLTELLPKLKGQRVILVTGPNRSGTTIAAHIIAYELSYTYVDEDEFIVDHPELLEEVFQRDYIVIQGPSICNIAHQLDCFVVMMRRPLEEIHASEKRVKWSWTKRELSKYNQTTGSIAEVKYAYWDNVQRFMCEGKYAELDYHSLEDHPLWIQDANRSKFKARQWYMPTPPAFLVRCRLGREIVKGPVTQKEYVFIVRFNICGAWVDAVDVSYMMTATCDCCSNRTHEKKFRVGGEQEIARWSQSL
jgi:hypothetical protein